MIFPVLYLLSLFFLNIFLSYSSATANTSWIFPYISTYRTSCPFSLLKKEQTTNKQSNKLAKKKKVQKHKNKKKESKVQKDKGARFPSLITTSHTWAVVGIPIVTLLEKIDGFLFILPRGINCK